MSKTRRALEIIAGLRDGWNDWELFIGPISLPPRDDREGLIPYRKRVAGYVKDAAIDYLAEKIDGG